MVKMVKIAKTQVQMYRMSLPVCLKKMLRINSRCHICSNNSIICLTDLTPLPSLTRYSPMQVSLDNLWVLCFRTLDSQFRCLNNSSRNLSSNNNHSSSLSNNSNSNNRTLTSKISKTWDKFLNRYSRYWIKCSEAQVESISSQWHKEWE